MGNLFCVTSGSLYIAATETDQMGLLLPCTIEREWSLGMTFSVFCQHGCVSSGLALQNEENHFFNFLTISPIFLYISVSRTDQMGLLPMKCHVLQFKIRYIETWLKFNLGKIVVLFLRKGLEVLIRD